MVFGLGVERCETVLRDDGSTRGAVKLSDDGEVILERDAGKEAVVLALAPR